MFARYNIYDARYREKKEQIGRGKFVKQPPQKKKKKEKGKQKNTG